MTDEIVEYQCRIYVLKRYYPEFVCGDISQMTLVQLKSIYQEYYDYAQNHCAEVRRIADITKALETTDPLHISNPTSIQLMMILAEKYSNPDN